MWCCLFVTMEKVPINIADISYVKPLSNINIWLNSGLRGLETKREFVLLFGWSFWNIKLRSMPKVTASMTYFFHILYFLQRKIHETHLKVLLLYKTEFNFHIPIRFKRTTIWSRCLLVWIIPFVEHSSFYVSRGVLCYSAHSNFSPVKMSTFVVQFFFHA
jgi:hypothetical protein